MNNKATFTEDAATGKTIHVINDQYQHGSGHMNDKATFTEDAATGKTIHVINDHLHAEHQYCKIAYHLSNMTVLLCSSSPQVLHLR